MSSKGTKINEASEKTSLSGTEKFPISDGSGSAKAVTANTIKKFVGSGSSVNVVDNLESTSPTDALSANQGHVIGERVTDLDKNIEGLDESKQEKLSFDEQNNFVSVKIGNKTYAISGVSEIVKPSTPSITPDGTTISASRTITIGCATSGVVIYYTTNGTTPTTFSSRYNVSSKPVVSAGTDESTTTTTIKAIAVKNGQESDVASLDVTCSRHVSVPTISKTGNEYSTSRSITLACTTSGTTLYYTTDGTTPTTSSTQYTGSFSITSTKTIKVLAVLSGWQSESASERITVGTLKMYYGLVDTVPTMESGITSLTGAEQKALPFVYSVPSTETAQKKVCYCYNKNLGDLTSIKDANGTEYFGNFVKTVVGNYNVYCMKSAANQAGMKYTFSK